jgi:hypothetical protein
MRLTLLHNTLAPALSPKISRNNADVPTHLHKYCNEFVGSISQWKFITLKAQYTTVDYN